MNNESVPDETDRKKESIREMENAARIINEFLTSLPPEKDNGAKFYQRGPCAVAKAKVTFAIAERCALAAVAVSEFGPAADILNSWKGSLFAGPARGEYDSMDMRHREAIDALVATAETMRKTIIACRPQ